ncbi:hypothetical protein [Azospirillum argentinense]
MRIAVHSLPPLLEAYQQVAARCAIQEPTMPDALDATLGNLEHVLACAEIETGADLVAKARFLLTYRTDPAMIPPVALETLVAGVERLCGVSALSAAAA